MRSLAAGEKKGMSGEAGRFLRYEGIGKISDWEGRYQALGMGSRPGRKLEKAHGGSKRTEVRQMSPKQMEIQRGMYLVWPCDLSPVKMLGGPPRGPGGTILHNLFRGNGLLE